MIERVENVLVGTLMIATAILALMVGLLGTAAIWFVTVPFKLLEAGWKRAVRHG
jgi:hypothetical protein